MCHLRQACRRFPFYSAVFVLTLVVGATVGGAEPSKTKPAHSEGEARYPVGAVAFKYAREHPHHPSLAPLYDLDVELLAIDLERCYVAPRPGYRTTLLRLSDIPRFQPVRLFYASALVIIAQRVVAHFNERGLIGVIVRVDASEVGGGGRDLRGEEQTRLTFVIDTARVVAMETIGRGERICEDSALNNPAHRCIVANSPLQPADSANGCTDLLRRDLLEPYLCYLKRYPGRTVDVQLTPSDSGEGVVLGFLVIEEKPWRVYASISNTGTQDHHKWVERAGFIHQHVTGGDDLLSVDYATTDLQGFHSVRGLYDAPFFGRQRLRWDVSGFWSQFTASEFGIFEDEFWGKQYKVTVGLAVNVYQCRDLFVDMRYSLQWYDVMVGNRLMGITGETDFLLPAIAVLFDCKRPASKVCGVVRLEGNLPTVVDTSVREMNELGRPTQDRWWMTVKGTLFMSRYLDTSRRDSQCADASGCGDPPCHEVALIFDGQYAFDYRLIPQMEKTIGGAHTVRGYPQSTVAGPTSFASSLEYHYHSFFCDRSWHSLLRAFIDVGCTTFNDPEPGEDGYTLVGYGVGLEADYRCYLRLRGDLGFAMRELEVRGVKAGHLQVFMSATVIY